MVEGEDYFEAQTIEPHSQIFHVNSTFEHACLKGDTIPIQFTAESTLLADIHGFQAVCLLDTGSSISLISSATRKKLPPSALKPLRLHKSFQIKSVNGSLSPVIAAYSIEFGFKGYVYPTTVFEASGLASQIILGRPFLSKYGATLSFNDYSLHLAKTYPLRIPYKASLAPGQGRLIVGKVSNSDYTYMKDCVGLLGIVGQSNCKPGLMVSDSLVTMARGHVPIYVTNNSSKYMTISDLANI